MMFINLPQMKFNILKTSKLSKYTFGVKKQMNVEN